MASSCPLHRKVGWESDSHRRPGRDWIGELGIEGRKSANSCIQIVVLYLQAVESVGETWTCRAWIRER